MNIADSKVAVIFPWQVPYDICRAPLDRGFCLLENGAVEEVKNTFGLNFVA